MIVETPCYSKFESHVLIWRCSKNLYENVSTCRQTDRQKNYKYTEKPKLRIFFILVVHSLEENVDDSVVKFSFESYKKINPVFSSCRVFASNK